MADISGQVALVVGASSGMGRATAFALATEGCRVVAAARREEVLQDLVAEAAEMGHEIAVAKVDVAQPSDVERLVSSTIEQFGRVDILVNAAGTNTPNRLLPVLTDEEWHRLINTNLHGAYYLTRALLPQMRSQGGGLIIHIGSVSGRWGDFSGAAYQASKHGLVGLAQATMIEERLNGIRVSVVFPGLCETPLLNLRKSPPSRETLDKAMQPEDIAMACAFIAKLPPRTYVPELIIMPGALQCVGQAVG
jgi:serine 3-dehydrogenase (NADP+)